MEVKTFFCDTYALIEIIKGNTNYKKYKNKSLCTSLLNLYELYYIMLRDHNEEIAKRYFFYFRSFTVTLREEFLFKAAAFKLQHKKQAISYVDALGYAIAQEDNFIFLTGDKEFKDIVGVEFVK